MSLFGALQVANNSLLANQIGLQTVSQNISNANTPGYSRAEVEYVPAPTQKFGNVLLGLGVQVGGVVQRIDSFLEERLRGATSDRSNGDIQSATYQELEGIINALSENGLDGSINRFFSNINEVLNSPQDVSARNLVVLQARTLTQNFRSIADQVQALQTDVNKQIQGATNDVNRLLEQIRTLNVRISSLEGGSVAKSDAVGLRDQRNKALADLSELIGIRVDEQDSSSANVFVNGEFLVFEGTARFLSTSSTTVDGQFITEVQIADSKSKLPTTSGKIAGLIASRDDILGSFAKKFDSFAKTFASEFNKVYASGQGLKGYTSVQSRAAIKDPGAPLELAGLLNTPVSGGFQVLVKNSQSGTTTTHQINIDLNGLGNDDTSLIKLQQQLDAIDGVSASISPLGELRINSEASNIEFSFANDTSGTLAALGINVLFTGTGARDMGVDSAVVADSRLFAASSGGIGADASNAAALAGFLERPLDSLDGDTFTTLQSRLLSEVSELSASSAAVAEGFQTFEGTLRGKQLAVSGVNLDEEAVKLMSFQRAFQASARFVSIINEMLETLVNI